MKYTHQKRSTVIGQLWYLVRNIAFSLLLVSFSQAQELSQLSLNDQNTAKATIGKLLAAQIEAWNQGKLETFMETYWKSEKLTFSSGGSTTRGWQATLDRYKKRYPTAEQMGQLHFDALEIELIESQTALVLGNWHLTLKDNSKRHGNFSIVINKIDGAWKIVHDHSSELKTP